MYVLRPVSIHLCYQKPNPASETVRLKSNVYFWGTATVCMPNMVFYVPTKFTVHETQNVFSLRNVMNTKIVLADF